MIIRYDSIASLREAYIGRKVNATKPTTDLSWYNNEDEATTLRLTLTGDTTLVPKAEEVLLQLETTIETTRKAWDRSPAGAFCSVPDVLAGLPTPMRRLVSTSSEVAPITIFADTGSSAGVGADTLRQRGIVILALVLALTRIRPVELYQLDVGSGIKDGETVEVAKINTTPLDLATACYVLTSAGFARRLVYQLEESINGASGQWPMGFNYSNPTNYYTTLKPKLVADASRCLIIPAARLNDDLLSNPVLWINTQIKHFTEEEEE